MTMQGYALYSNRYGLWYTGLRDKLRGPVFTPYAGLAELYPRQEDLLWCELSPETWVSHDLRAVQLDNAGFWSPCDQKIEYGTDTYRPRRKKE